MAIASLLRHSVPVFTMTVFCLSPGSLPAQPAAWRAQPTQSHSAASARHRKSKETRSLPYPYPEFTTYRIPVETGKSEDAGGSVTVDMKSFWNSLNYKDQQSLSAQKFLDYLKYVRDRVNAPVLKPAKYLHSSHSSYGRSGKRKDTRSIPYPFLWLQTYSVPIEKWANTDKPAIVVIDMKEFWDNPHMMPYEDKQILSHRAFNDYIQYVREDVNPRSAEAPSKTHTTSNFSALETRGRGRSL